MAVATPSFFLDKLVDFHNPEFGPVQFPTFGSEGLFLLLPKPQNGVLAAAGIAQKNYCALTRLDCQQEAGLMSSAPLGENLIAIQRGLTMSSTAISKR